MDTSDTGTGPLILGLTGPIACGKSTVGDILLDLGAADRIDADRVVHDLMQSGTDVTAAITTEFGQDVLGPDGAVDRARLGQIVFSDQSALRRLEAITHPAVRTAIRDRLRQFEGTGAVVVIDAIKLLQSDLLPLTDAVWVVACSPDAQMRRLTDLRSMSVAEAHARLEAMPSFAHPRVTRIIDNSGTIDDLRARVVTAWRSFTGGQTRAPTESDV